MSESIDLWESFENWNWFSQFKPMNSFNSLKAIETLLNFLNSSGTSHVVLVRSPPGKWRANSTASRRWNWSQVTKWIDTNHQDSPNYRDTKADGFTMVYPVRLASFATARPGLRSWKRLSRRSFVLRAFASFSWRLLKKYIVPKFHHTLSFMVESRAVASLCLNTVVISRIVRRKDKDNLDSTIVSTSLNISSSEVL